MPEKFFEKLQILKGSGCYYIDTARETKTKQKEETQMVFTAFLICAAVGLAAGLLTGAYESENEAMANE